MASGHPDFVTEVTTELVEAGSFRSGLDTDKPVSPAAGDIWLARDTYYLYVCNVAGAWEKVTKLYLLLAGGTMSGAIAMGTNKITGLAAPAADGDAARKVDVDTVNAKLDDVSQAQPTRVLGTTYQNTTGKIKVVSVTVSNNSDNSGLYSVQAYCDANSSPTTSVGLWRVTAGANQLYSWEGMLVLIVPPSYYYKVVDEGGANPSVKVDWVESDLL